MTIERPDLAGAFASPKRTVDRAAGLTGLLPPPRPRPAVDQQTPTQQPDTEPAAAKQEPTPGRQEPAAVKPVRALKPAKAPVSASADTITNVAVYLEPDLLDRARAHRRVTQTTYDELVVTAFTAVPDHELQHALAPQRPVQPGPGMPARQRRPRGTAGIQVQLRLTGVQRTWLDEKQAAVDAPSRSALVAAALRLYLTD